MLTIHPQTAHCSIVSSSSSSLPSSNIHSYKYTLFHVDGGGEGKKKEEKDREMKIIKREH
jgi:hypothetical protein